MPACLPAYVCLPMGLMTHTKHVRGGPHSMKVHPSASLQLQPAMLGRIGSERVLVRLCCTKALSSGQACSGRAECGAADTLAVELAPAISNLNHKLITTIAHIHSQSKYQLSTLTSLPLMELLIGTCMSKSSSSQAYGEQCARCILP